MLSFADSDKMLSLLQNVPLGRIDLIVAYADALQALQRTRFHRPLSLKAAVLIAKFFVKAHRSKVMTLLHNSTWTRKQVILIQLIDWRVQLCLKGRPKAFIRMTGQTKTPSAIKVSSLITKTSDVDMKEKTRKKKELRRASC